MKKKFLALALSLAMVLTLAACGGGNDPAPADDGDAGTGDGGGAGESYKVGLVILSGDHGFTGESVRHAEMQAEAVMEQYDNLEVVVKSCGEAADQITEIETIYVEKTDLLPFAYGAKDIVDIATIPTSHALQADY